MKPWIRNAAASASALLAVGGVAVAGVDGGTAAHDVKLLSGAAWLASGRVGQLSLLDGPSTEVSAQVQVASPGSVLDVVQAGPNAYAVDQSAGTVRRIDGATFEVSAPESPIPGARGGLTAFAGSAKLYIVDTQRGLFTHADPRTGRALGDAKTLAAQIAPGTTGIDEQGTLWIADNATGDVRMIADGDAGRIEGVTRPGRAVLTIAQGRPVVVDVAARKASVLDPLLRRTRATIDLDLRNGEDVQVSGSPYGNRFYLVAPRGVLTICELGEESCLTTVPLAGGRLGAAVEAGNRLFVPDYTTGQVWIVDLAKKTVLAQPQVLRPARQFQLVSRDGVVFFNDPDSDRAGVITLDGTVLDVAKYDAKDPGKGLNAPITGVPTRPDAPQPAPQQPSTPQPSTPRPSTPQTSAQQPSPQEPPRQPPQPPAQPPTPAIPGPYQPPSQPQAPPPQPRQPTPTPPQQPQKPVVRITPSKASPMVNESITLKVDDSKGTVPTHATWSFGDSQQGTGAMVGHKWATVGTYQVSVEVTMPDGQTATASRPIDVTKPPDTTVPNVVGMTENAATTTLTGANLRTTVKRVASNTAAAGIVITQDPASGKVVPPQAMVTVQVSSGKPAAIDLLARAASASWRTGAGTLPYDGNDGDVRGFAKPRSGLYLEDHSAPAFLETHPQWVDNGYIEGTFTLPRAVVAGDRFKATVGFMAVASPPSAGGGTFVVSVVRNGATTVITTVPDSASDGVLRPINVDLTPYAGATQVKFRFNAGPTAAQDWASWVGPRIEG